jgi:hypothetical protein
MRLPFSMMCSVNAGAHEAMRDSRTSIDFIGKVATRRSILLGAQVLEAESQQSPPQGQPQQKQAQRMRQQQAHLHPPKTQQAQEQRQHKQAQPGSASHHTAAADLVRSAKFKMRSAHKNDEGRRSYSRTLRLVRESKKQQQGRSSDRARRMIPVESAEHVRARLQAGSDDFVYLGELESTEGSAAGTHQEVDLNEEDLNEEQMSSAEKEAPVLSDYDIRISPDEDWFELMPKHESDEGDLTTGLVRVHSKKTSPQPLSENPDPTEVDKGDSSTQVLDGGNGAEDSERQEEEWAQILKMFEKDWPVKKEFVEDVKQNGLPSLRISSRAEAGPALQLHPIRQLRNVSSVEWEIRCVV